jgi:hypothetical protein
MMNDDKFLLCEICIWAGATAEYDCPRRDDAKESSATASSQDAVRTLLNLGSQAKFPIC